MFYEKRFSNWGFVFCFSYVSLSLSLVSAAWWNPFDWFEPQLSPGDCVDSDGGKNYDEVGIATGDFNGEYGDYYDSCGYPGPRYILKEYYCGIDGNVEIEYKYDCLNGCSAGKCLPSECEIDSDCDDGKEYSIDTCDNKHQCKYDPYPPICTDSDGGTALGVKGFIQETYTTVLGVDYQRNGTDSCSETKILEEHDCDDPGSAHNPKQYYCKNGCLEGACQGTFSNCNPGQKCASTNKLVFLSGNCEIDYQETRNCRYGCSNDKCKSAWGIEVLRFIMLDPAEIPYNHIILDNSSVMFNVTLKNNANRRLTNIPITVDDNKGWKQTKDIDFEIGEEKSIIFEFTTSENQILNNPHIFNVSSGNEGDTSISVNYDYYLIVLDNNTLLDLSQGEEKQVIVGEEEYNVSIAYMDPSRLKLYINEEVVSSSRGSYNRFPNGGYLGVFDIIFLDYPGGLRQATFALAPPGINATCEDTDDGKNYSVPGQTCFGVQCEQDYCIEGWRDLVEYYCEGDEIKSEIIECTPELGGEDCIDAMCTNVAPVPPCDVCKIGTKICVDENSYEECISQGECSHYGETQMCDEGSLCEDGECIPENACTQVGKRKSGEYCSSERIWVEQKTIDEICQRDFECQDFGMFSEHYLLS